jgi:hypothetical protein
VLKDRVFLSIIRQDAPNAHAASSCITFQAHQWENATLEQLIKYNLKRTCESIPVTLQGFFSAYFRWTTVSSLQKLGIRAQTLRPTIAGSGHEYLQLPVQLDRRILDYQCMWAATKHKKCPSGNAGLDLSTRHR